LLPLVTLLQYVQKMHGMNNLKKRVIFSHNKPIHVDIHDGMHTLYLTFFIIRQRVSMLRLISSPELPDRLRFPPRLPFHEWGCHFRQE